MNIVETVTELQSLISNAKEQGKVVGFIPTMGALHAGHVSLVSAACAQCDFVVTSIFVNPTQFNNLDDLKHYPRTLERDCALLEEAGVDIVFIPTEKEIYPEKDTRAFDFGRLDKVMEGVHRPGHFNGVAQVVSKLFDMVKPHKSFFGEKDFQQLAIIKVMVKQLGFDVEIVSCPIVREADGLAMSSRNVRLTKEHRAVAPRIAQILLDSKSKRGSLSVAEVKAFVIEAIAAEPLLELEYFEIADALTLEQVKQWSDAGDKVGCIAVFAGDIRLIDNILY